MNKGDFIELEGTIRKKMDAFYKGQAKKDYITPLYNVIRKNAGQFSDYTIGAPGQMVNWDGSVHYDDFVGGYKVDYRAKKKDIGLQIPKNMWEDSEFEAIKERTGNVLLGVQKTLNRDSAYAFNHATDSTITGPDGSPLIGATHYTVPDADAQNNLFSGKLLNYEDLEYIQLKMEGWKDDRGDDMLIDGNFIVAGRQQRKNLQKLIGSNKEAYVGDNTMNVDSDMEYFIHPLIRGKRFFVCNKELMLGGGGLNWFMRQDPRNLERDGGAASGDFNTEMLSWKAVGRYDIKWHNWFFIAMGTGE